MADKEAEVLFDGGQGRLLGNISLLFQKHFFSVDSIISFFDKS